MVVFAPGRVTLLGKHTEHAAGWLLPAGLDKGAVVAVALNSSGRARLYNYDSDVAAEAPLTAAIEGGKSWRHRLLGVAAGFEQRGLSVPGFDCMFGSDLPVGAGLSVAAAVTCGLAFALNELLGARLEPLQLARLAYGAEHAGAEHDAPAGLLDYFTSMCSRPDQLARLDCRSQQYEYFPFAARDFRLVLCDAGVSRSQAEHSYAVRRQECAEGLRMLRRYFPELLSLRDVTPMQLHRYRQELGESIYRRCAFVLAENQRVELAGLHLGTGNLRAFGQQLFAAHAGLRNDYAVSCPELDELVQIAQEFPDVLGARMLGGVGSCTINLLPAPAAEAFVHHAEAAYARRRSGALATYQFGLDGAPAIL